VATLVVTPQREAPAACAVRENVKEGLIVAETRTASTGDTDTFTPSTREYPEP